MRAHRLVLAHLFALPLLLSPLAAQEATFTRVEYWECPSENVDALASAVDSIWGPIFDEVTEEGHFSSWHVHTPVGARDLEFVGAEETDEEITPPWQAVGVWTAESREAMDAAWEDFFERLEAEHPDVPTPARFCGDLLIVDYEREAGS